MYEIWAFLEMFFEKTWIFSKSIKVANFLLNAHQMILFKNVFSTFTVTFLQKKWKIFKIGKIRNYSKEGYFLKKQRFGPFKNIFDTNGKQKLWLFIFRSYLS